jgi:mgtE-like transporter
MKTANHLNHGRYILSSKVFLRTLRETLIAYSFDIGGLFAGFMVASQLNVFRLSPWAIAIYPAILSAKGVISGLLSGRLSTALHIGTIYPRLFKNSQTFYRLVAALISVTLLTSIAMSVVSLVFGLAFWNITLEDFPAIFLVVVATMALGLLLMLVTMNVAFITFKRGLDPDVVVYPIMSTVADIVITLCYVLCLNLYFLFDAGKYALVLIGLSHLILIFYILPRNVRAEEFVKTVKESLVTMFLVAFIVNITGTVLKRISTIVESRKEIYTVYPALTDLVGDVGSVVGSTATTKLALGLLKPSLTSMKNHALQIFSAWTASVILFAVLAALSLSMNAMFAPILFLNFIFTLFITNIVAVAAIVLLSYGVGILTFQRGLDPDNFVIPLESSLADSLTSIALLVALIITG